MDTFTTHGYISTIYIECCNLEKAGSRGACTDMSVAQLPSSGLALVRGGQPPAAER